MAHSLEANTSYDVVLVAIAIPRDERYELADSLNEALRPIAMDGGIADYSLFALEKTYIQSTGNVFDEGELFSDDLDKYCLDQSYMVKQKLPISQIRAQHILEIGQDGNSFGNKPTYRNCLTVTEIIDIVDYWKTVSGTASFNDIVRLCAK